VFRSSAASAVYYGPDDRLVEGVAAAQWVVWERVGHFNAAYLVQVQVQEPREELETAVSRYEC